MLSFAINTENFRYVFAGGGRTIVFHTIEFHATDFSFEHMSNRSYVIYMNV